MTFNEFKLYCIYFWGGDTECGEWKPLEEPEYEDFV